MGLRGAVLSWGHTHSDIGQFVSGAMRVDAIKVGAVTVHTTKDQSSPNVALVPAQRHSSMDEHTLVKRTLLSRKTFEGYANFDQA